MVDFKAFLREKEEAGTRLQESICGEGAKQRVEPECRQNRGQCVKREWEEQS